MSWFLFLPTFIPLLHLSSLQICHFSDTHHCFSCSPTVLLGNLSYVMWINWLFTLYPLRSCPNFLLHNPLHFMIHCHSSICTPFCLIFFSSSNYLFNFFNKLSSFVNTLPLRITLTCCTFSPVWSLNLKVLFSFLSVQPHIQPTKSLFLCHISLLYA